MMKRNNKQVVRDLHIPMSSHLAANIRHKQLAKQAEHEEMKRLVLDYNQRQEEESYNGKPLILIQCNNSKHSESRCGVE